MVGFGNEKWTIVWIVHNEERFLSKSKYVIKSQDMLLLRGISVME